MVLDLPSCEDENMHKLSVETEVVNNGMKKHRLWHCEAIIAANSLHVDCLLLSRVFIKNSLVSCPINP